MLPPQPDDKIYTYAFYQTPRSPEYQRGFEDGYNVARQRMLDEVSRMTPVATQTFTSTQEDWK
jgi:hypothetical protein